MSSSYRVIGLSFPVLFLNQQWSPPLRLQASHCSTFRIVCDVPSIAVFCSESVEWFPAVPSKFFLKTLSTFQLAAVITGARDGTTVTPLIISSLNLLAPELFFLILAHPVYKMWIIQEPNTLELWNKLHFEEEKKGEYIPWLKYSVPIFVE